MIKSYLKVALRNLYKNKFYAIINIVGLGVAMAMCVGAYVNFQFGKSFNTMHENKDSIYLVTGYTIEDGDRTDWSLNPLPMGPAIRNEVPGIEKFTRLSALGATARYGEDVFNETFHLVDRDFFEMFTFPIVSGSWDATDDHSGMVITDDIARKYFGDEDPLGKTLIVSPDGEHEFNFTVTGVVAEPPLNSSLQFDIVIPIERIEDLRGFELSNWKYWSRATFIQVAGNASPATIEERLQAYLPITNEANQAFELAGFYLTPLPELASVARDLRGQYFPNMHPAALMGPTVTALLVLLLACFNFINTAIAFAARRMREIGIRKVVGGVRGQLVRQFLGENLILCFFALIVAAILSEIFVPAYDSLWPELSLTMNYSENFGLVGFFVGLLLFTAIAAGSYPAFYISAFRPIDILRNKQKLRGTNPLIRVLLTFQLALSMTAIIAAVILQQNAEYINNVDLGFNRENVLMVPIQGESGYTLMREALRDQPGVEGMGASRHLMGRYFVGTDVRSEETERTVYLFEIGENYFETAGFQLVAGRSFDSNLATDVHDAAIVNQTLAREFGWTDPIGRQLTFVDPDSENVCNIIGVVRDFYPNGMNSRVAPTVLRLSQPENYNYLAIKCDPENLAAVSGRVDETWKNIFPHIPYNAFWIDRIVADEVQVNNSIRLVFLYIAAMVVIISTMGLFALVSLNISKRTKEIGIRKVLGATVSNIGVLVCREFVLLVIIGSVLAGVMGYFLVGSLLGSIWVYYVDFGILPFVIAPILVLAVAFTSVSFRVFAAAGTNPVETLRYE